MTRVSVRPGYESLSAVHDRALDQAQAGKGAERHACGEPFEEQQIVQLGEWMSSTAFAIGQACKKAIESTRLEPQAAIAELLGAINYLSAAVIVIDRREQAPALVVDEACQLLDALGGRLRDGFLVYHGFGNAPGPWSKAARELAHDAWRHLSTAHPENAFGHAATALRNGWRP